MSGVEVPSPSFLILFFFFFFVVIHLKDVLVLLLQQSCPLWRMSCSARFRCNLWAALCCSVGASLFCNVMLRHITWLRSRVVK